MKFSAYLHVVAIYVATGLGFKYLKIGFGIEALIIAATLAMAVATGVICKHIDDLKTAIEEKNQAQKGEEKS